MISCRIVIQDEVNVKVENLPVEYRRKIANKLKFQVPYARYLPQYKPVSYTHLTLPTT